MLSINSKKLIVLYVVLLIAALGTMFVLRCNVFSDSKRDYDEIAFEGVLRIVTGYDSTGYFVSGDTIEGFQYELSQAISALSGFEILIIPELSLAAGFKGLNARKYDIVAHNIPITTEMRKKYLFADPIIFNKQVLIQRTAEANGSRTPIRNQLDLAQETLHVTQGSPTILRIRNLQHEIGDTIYIVEENRCSDDQLISRVAIGEIDYAVCDMQTATVAAQRFPEIDIDTDISFMQLQSWAVRKESTALCDSINRWLQHLRDSGLYDTIYNRYYKQ